MKSWILNPEDTEEEEKIQMKKQRKLKNYAGKKYRGGADEDEWEEQKQKDVEEEEKWRIREVKSSIYSPTAIIPKNLHSNIKHLELQKNTYNQHTKK